MPDERELGRFEGMVLQKLNDLDRKLDDLGTDISFFKQDTYGRLNQNAQELARQRGWMAGIGVAAGAIGGFIKEFIFKH